MPKHQRNILFLTTAFPNDQYPFDGIFVYRHARALSRYGESIVVLTARESVRSEKEIKVQTRDYKDLQVYDAYYPLVKGPLKLKKKVEALKQGYDALIKEHNIDLVHVHFSYPAGFAAIWIKEKFNVPYIITEHSSMFNPYRKDMRFKILRKLIKRVLENAVIIMPVSDDLGIHMKRISSASHYETIPNVVDTDTFTLKKDTESNQLKVLHVSSLAEPKNTPGLLKVIKEVTSKRPDIIFTIVGEHRDESIEADANKLEIPDTQLQFLYKLNEQEVAKQMQQHDVFLLFSNYENLPCVLIEAQSSGLPILSTNVGGIKEIVPQKSLGKLVDRGDVKSMVELLVSFSKEDYNKEEIRERALSEYSEKSVSDKYIEMYNRVLKT